MDMLPSVPEQVLGFIAVPDTIVAVVITTIVIVLLETELVV